MPKILPGTENNPTPMYPIERVILTDEMGVPYKAGVTVQQVEGGFDPTGLSTEAKQNAIISALQDLTSAYQNADVQEVVVTGDELPPVSGQATATKQDQILSALNTLTTLAADDQTFRSSGTTRVSAETLPLATGASTASKQDQILAALGTLTQALSQTLSVTGTVTLDSNDVDVSGSVAITNASIPVTASGTFPVTLEGGATAAKQDALLSGIQALTTAVQAPQPITDNGGSITVDGVVGISGTVGTTQSGSWNVGISGTPTVNVGNPSLAVTQSGTWQIQTTPGASATSAALTSFRSGTLSTAAQAVKTSSGRVYQYTFFNPNATTVYVHLHDALITNVTPGTTVPKMSFAVPTGSTLDGYWSISHGFANAISISASNNWDGSGTPASTLQVTIGFA